ncbi:conserved Plasmodium protein, unknown function [Plasmodium berghei]|uniref:Uncharacterized protein n=1 Tax=Plasmodium berghei TaxID=5821 RepID=A0A1C6YA56_PLABE|nr:conserved Plasmodium protein, unknown function [Plasmodium berghei]SCO60232.1 conserved Plasmodium protein, unknown function [Plasmodium berghei]
MISVTLTNDYAYDKLSDLGLCVFTGNLKRLKKLLKKNGINTKFTNDSSLLHICSHNEDPNMFYFLLNKGCDYTHINVKEKNEKNGKNVIGYSNYDVYDIKDIINIKNNDGDTALHIAIKNGFYECFFLLIKKGADTNIKDYFGMDSYELIDLYEKKEKLYDCYSSTYANMFNLLVSMRRCK